VSILDAQSHPTAEVLAQGKAWLDVFQIFTQSCLDSFSLEFPLIPTCSAPRAGGTKGTADLQSTPTFSGNGQVNPPFH
jgi:hypothetical protein